MLRRNWESPRRKLTVWQAFMKIFSFEAKGKYVIKVCDGTACHVRKSIPILEGLYKELGLGKKKHTTDDQLFTVETVSCLGACGLAPAVMVNDEVHPKMTPEKMSELIKKLRRKRNEDRKQNAAPVMERRV